MIRVTLLQNYQPPGFSMFYARTARIEYDAKRPKAKKIHSIYFQQGDHYGMVGDKAWTLTHSQLLEMEAAGIVQIERTR